ncbi:hypothetical protein [Vibrio anguillarum]|uniref:hypothetical protein n=1 Tax=Vibrio anguillarum TaxID=55601 RepID=UPI001AD82B02|nr:hypothetical protein [Vibrio anguillarum]MBT2931261.1 hypothetical protein [Vibrio anguillarum]
MLEKDLQAEIYNALCQGRFCELINGIGYYRGMAKVNLYAEDAFSIETSIKQRYTESVLHIYRRLKNEEYEIIGDENPKNISLNRNERLFPDFLIHDYERNFYVFELKVGVKTEREAITEIFAYIFELKNHLPHINNREISIVIISESFGTLLSHAVLQLISFFGVRVLCLKVCGSRLNRRLDIFNPINLIVKNEERLTKRSFSTICLPLYQTKSMSKKANQNIEHIYKIAEDMILEKANRLNSDGFCVLYRNNEFGDEVGPIAKYYIKISLLNPFELMDIETIYNRNSPLSQSLYDLHRESDYHLQSHFDEIVSDGVDFLNKFYHVGLEGMLTLEQFEEVYNPSLMVDAIKCNVWGEFGTYVKKLIYSECDGFDFFNEEKDHTHPFELWEILAYLFGET